MLENLRNAYNLYNAKYLYNAYKIETVYNIYTYLYTKSMYKTWRSKIQIRHY